MGNHKEQVGKIKRIAEGFNNSYDIIAALNNTDKDDGALINVFAGVYKAAQLSLGLTPFDEQLIAAIELYNGKVVEMATGEGKTLAAVFPACLNAFLGKNLHVLTFNDYLAKRDYNWMKPIYDIMNVSVSYISQNMNNEQRQKAYSCDVCYLTAKEAGFDLLRDFICTDSSLQLHKRMDFAIVDEADSILIDEARIPLVIAGNVQVTEDKLLKKVNGFVKTLSDGDYETNTETNNVYLSEQGAVKLEHLLDCGNLYSEHNMLLLAKINACLEANFRLCIDKDYIVKDEQVLIVDEFTGRIAQNRRYPGDLHAAVEIKEGISPKNRGSVMGMVALQYFMRSYDKLAGMTGTAKAAEDELYKLYDLQVTVIPPHKPCIRDDLPLQVYTHGEAKWEAVIEEIKKEHKTRRPILVGTSSIEESESLTKLMEREGLNPVVLNAKNDEEEAEIIKNAGMPGALTISTNMAGRGVDIRLGGAEEKYKDEVVKSGGLYVIGTNLHESRRIDYQLRGRAGRQGDVGTSKFFCAMDDSIMITHDLKSLIPAKKIPAPQKEPVTDKTVCREVERIRRISEGVTFEQRKHLMKFTLIIEKHRKITFDARNKILTGRVKPQIWQESVPETYSKLAEKYGSEKVNALQKQLLLTALNDFWAEYLDYTSYIKEGIHLTIIGGKNPYDEFNIIVEDYYTEMKENIIGYMGEKAEEILKSGITDIAEYQIDMPTATWTYLVDDNTDQFSKLPFMMKKPADNRVKQPLFSLKNLLKK